MSKGYYMNDIYKGYCIFGDNEVSVAVYLYTHVRAAACVVASIVRCVRRTADGAIHYLWRERSFAANSLKLRYIDNKRGIESCTCIPR